MQSDRMPRREDTEFILRTTRQRGRRGGREETDLSSGVDDVEIEFLSFVFDDFLERILYRWIVRVHKMGIDELYGQG